ncbi:DMT family transporter [Dehalobacter sp. DCM]|uniref:DMT family transporter n=1 Tax=Dehalobacter sp. DCM TaxID=2907827 RepID=UPI003082068E|nr:DMT family transporter [Dehalobacter sp. DCM]
MLKLLSIPAVLAALSGAAMALQGTLNSQLSQKSSLLSSTLIVHILGSIIALGAVVIWKVPLSSHKWNQIPWYLYLGGVLSVAIIALVAVSISKIGVCNATTAIILGQVGMAVLIDHFGLFGVQKISWNPWQLLGLLLFAGGAKLLFR